MHSLAASQSPPDPKTPRKFTPAPRSLNGRAPQRVPIRALSDTGQSPSVLLKL